MDFSDTVQLIIDEAKGALTKPGISNKEMAILESDIWEKVRRAGWNHQRQYEFMQTAFGTKTNASSGRAILLNAGKVSDLLWPMVDSGEMALATATTLLRKAKAEVMIAKQSNVTIEPETALKCVLEEYNTLTPARTPNGHIVRKKLPSSIPRMRKPYKARKPKKFPENGVVREDQRAKGFWSEMRTLIARFVSPKFDGVDPIIEQTLYREFERDLKIFLDEFAIKVSRTSKEAQRDKSLYPSVVNRGELIWACRTLCIDPPKPNKSIDLEKANKQKKKLARQYHPDRLGGSEVTRPLYEAVISAYSTLEKYSEMYGKSET
jgi:hypothetical protein